MKVKIRDKLIGEEEPCKIFHSEFDGLKHGCFHKPAGRMKV